MKNNQIMENALLDLGHDFCVRGTGYIIQAARDYVPGMGLTKELYPALARANNTTPGAVERCMRHSIEKAWTRRGNMEARTKYFGNSVDPERGMPQVGEYVARMARLYRQAAGQE